MQIDVHLEQGKTAASMGAEVGRGLRSRPKRLPSKYFYDERGSLLFEEITEQPEYYLTRVEQALLEERSIEIVRLTRSEELVELGAGSAKKTRCLIEAGLEDGSLGRYVPLEFSPEMAERTARELKERYPALSVHAVIGDFENHLSEIPSGGRRLVALLGSTIGNFDREQAVDLLCDVASLLSDGGYLLLGTDLVKGKETLDAAYNDRLGVTAEFNRNILNVINDRLGADFDPRAFEHVAFFNERKARIETYLRSIRDQSVRIDDIDVDVAFAKDEMMRTEISCKYTRESVEEILATAGLRLDHWFTDRDRNFALSLSRPI